MKSPPRSRKHKEDFHRETKEKEEHNTNTNRYIYIYIYMFLKKARVVPVRSPLLLAFFCRRSVVVYVVVDLLEY